MLMFNMRLGIGFDIESTEDVCYILTTDEDETYVAGFEGLTITLPFIRILLGEFHELDVSLLDN